VVIHWVASAREQVATYERAVARLTTQPAGGRVLGDVLRSLLEDTRSDGLESDDITLVVGRCYRAAVSWLPPERVDVTTLLAALAGALGIHEPGVTHEALDLSGSNADESSDPSDTVPVKPPTWPDYAWHAPLLVADLLPFGPAMLRGYIETAFASTRKKLAKNCPEQRAAGNGGNGSRPRSRVWTCRKLLGRGTPEMAERNDRLVGYRLG
jgi:hypothetical protein